MVLAVEPRGPRLQLEDDPQGCINLTELVEAEVSDYLAEASWVHGSGLFCQDAGRGCVEEDLRAEACGSRGGGGRRDEQR
jgi:hypothetical protein